MTMPALDRMRIREGRQPLTIVANWGEAWAILREFGQLQIGTCRPKMLVNAWPSETEQCQVFAIYVVPFVTPWASMS